MSDTGAAPEDRALDYTGERMVPEAADPQTFWQHILRYRFALQFAVGKRVLDIACGEGYGSAALLRGGAQSVVGVDIDATAVEHARERYGIDARQGDAVAIPLPDASLDLIVSFETIEHVPSPGAFLDECVRLLAPGGKLLVSTPNKGVYHAGIDPNPFHCSEMTLDELTENIRSRFASHRIFTQHFVSASAWSPRVLHADHSFWTRSQILTGLRSRVVSSLCESAGDGGAVRRSPVETILDRSSSRPMGRLFEPYSVRSGIRAPKDRPIIFICLATRGS
jgi:2-polyprenyl-3-methyl-5-hydroxy-6-metoxy-1,4-benzoquinol methylase